MEEIRPPESMMAAPQSPTIGRIVHMVTPNGPRPVIVTAVHNYSYINGQLFHDGDGRAGKGDGLPNVEWVTNVALDVNLAVGTWHWPPRA